MEGKDKYTDQYTLRITHSFKHHIEDMSPEFKKRLNTKLRLTMEEIIHDSKFHVGMYSNEEPEDVS